MHNRGISRIRIKDIAGLAGVSAGTVDRVLHDRGEVSAKTRKRVMDIIRDMDYRPDVLASTLAARKPLRIAALIPREQEGSPFWKYPLAGIKEGLLEVMHFGISLETWFFDYADRTSFLEASARMLAERPRGVIMAPVFTDDAARLIEECNMEGIPVVLINAGICTGSCLAFVGQDSLQSGMVAARLMHLGLGEGTDILVVNFIREQGNQEHIRKREEGFRRYFTSVTGKSEINIRRLDLQDTPRGQTAGAQLAQDQTAGAQPAQVQTAGAQPAQVQTAGAQPAAIQPAGARSAGIQPSAIKQARIQPAGALEEAVVEIGRPAGIFVTNSRVFRVARFLQEKKMENIFLVGYDLLEENKEFLRRGTIDFLISQKPREQGYLSMITLYQHLVFKREVEKDQYLPVDIITKENLEHYKYT